MNAESTSSFRPPWAVTAWCDDVAVYVELPMEPTPYIQKFPLSEAGFAKALRALQELRRQAPTRYGNAKFEMPKTQPMVKRKEPAFTDEEREAARAVLKKLGLI